MDQKTNERLNLERLRARVGEKPRTKAGQVRQAWPEIKALFAAGHSLKDIWAWLNEIGIEIGYARLSQYTGQLKRREQTAPLTSATESVVGPPSTQNGAVVAAQDVGGGKTNHQTMSVSGADPLTHIRSREERRVGFQYNPEPDAKKLI